ncbi:DUF305 domain-containing protein [Deinococcus arcticus]|uniref:DUF305 domain-containing protein n=1 Tax=Deinococcus arcticus TaxID=2136176 RepID=A0A2T3WBI6_9DEIO|nr:DUF305 domain-containing protein [Deinococcus arcticus]PTA69268.1 DUF305 domain-containing protein [Deinococcus arcticus]
MTFKPLALTTLALLLSPLPAQAQADHSMHGAAPATAKAAPAGLATLSGRAFDRAYLSMMIAHHQGAVDMARAVQGRVKDAQVKAWVAAVIRDQSREISVMTGWLSGLGGVDTARRDQMAGHMKGMVAPLKTAANPDRAFVQGMRPHHASALEMASLALQNSGDSRILKLSRDIITGQAAELYAFQVWLLRQK